MPCHLQMPSSSIGSPSERTSTAGTGHTRAKRSIVSQNFGSPIWGMGLCVRTGEKNKHTFGSRPKIAVWLNESLLVVGSS